ncbi:MAG TPA: hypothetical protein VF190_11395 [Rhodothermales bacterium]
MTHFIRINSRFLPVHAIASVDDFGSEILVTVRDPSSGPRDIRLEGDAAEALRSWLNEHTAVALDSQTELLDNGVRIDD